MRRIIRRRIENLQWLQSNGVVEVVVFEAVVVVLSSYIIIGYGNMDKDRPYNFSFYNKYIQL